MPDDDDDPLDDAETLATAQAIAMVMGKTIKTIDFDDEEHKLTIRMDDGSGLKVSLEDVSGFARMIVEEG